MMECSDELKAFIHAAKEMFVCNLYEMTLGGGTVLRYADYDMDITLSDGRKFVHTGPMINRGQTSITAKIEVDSMDVTVLADQTDIVGQTTWMQAAQLGAFDEAELVNYLCFMSSPGVVVGVLEWFGGYVDVEDGGGIEMSWSVNSYMKKLNVDYPTRKFYPTCQYTVYGPGCELNVDDWTVTGTVTQVISKQEIYTNLTFGNGYYDLGGAEFISGNLIGAGMSIKNSYAENGRIVFIVALDELPAVGDTFKIYPGCAGTPAICSTKFGNFAKNRSTPYIPLKETVV